MTHGKPRDGTSEKKRVLAIQNHAASIGIEMKRIMPQKKEADVAH